MTVIRGLREEPPALDASSGIFSRTWRLEERAREFCCRESESGEVRGLRQGRRRKKKIARGSYGRRLCDAINNFSSLLSSLTLRMAASSSEDTIDLTRELDGDWGR